MNQSQKLRKALKKTLVPEIEAAGFQGKFPEFQRKENASLHLLSVQFDKYGGGFHLEFCVHPAGDLETSWGEVFPEQDITVAHAPVDSRARLQEKGHKSSFSEDWFRFEGLSPEELERLAKRVADLFPQVDDWLRGRKVGAQISDPSS